MNTPYLAPKLDKAEITQSLEAECELTLEHAEAHIVNAKEAQADKNWGQLAHECDVAARILLVIAMCARETVEVVEE